jgi:hypothetical protein
MPDDEGLTVDDIVTARPTVADMQNPNDPKTHDPQREIIKALGLISLLLLVAVVLLAAIVFGFAEITVVPET